MKTEHDEVSSDLLTAMRMGDSEALGNVFSTYRERLRKIVRFRMDHRLGGRLSESDVLQEAYIAAAQRLEHFAQYDDMSPFLWLRLVLGQKLTDLHREHLLVAKRNADREIRMPSNPVSGETSFAIAAHLVGQMTAASELVSRAEQIERLEGKLNEMDPIDREVIALRHFEELSNGETAKILGIETSAASKRYLRAMSRLAELMKSNS
ncbi:MAG: sigma-70 family RNA polymerase sigma factor [Aureliella sp.]